MYKSIDPATGQELKTYETISDSALDEKLGIAHASFKTWRDTAFADRAKLMLDVADTLLANKSRYGAIITAEMGKPLAEAVAEVEKCVTVCKYYAENAEKFLANKLLESDHKKSFISYEPLGIIYAVMPWNFPFWQVIRCAVPAIMAGNVVMLKHAENVPQCSEVLEVIFLESGFPAGVFTQLMISHEQSDKVIASDNVRGVSLTGSEKAGSTVASNAGKSIKRSVLELGGSDPFIVLNDADVEKAAETGVKARMQNAGQSCIAAKRFILHKDIAQQFTELFVSKTELIKVGDPTDVGTRMGPLARKDLVDTLDKQIKNTVEMGARVLTGGHRLDMPGNYYKPTVITNIPKGSPAYREELFGPCASIFVVNNEDEAIELANDTAFGLGASLWSRNEEKAMKVAKRIESGSVYINSMVKSDARLPFGGVKHSGYGRELSEVGIHEFVNIKTMTWD